MHKKERIITFVLLGICLVLIGAFFVGRSMRESQEQDRLSEKDFISTFDVKAVNRIEITKAEVITVLEKQEDLWIITSSNNAEADNDAVDTALATIENSKIQALISTNTNQDSAYGLSSDQVVHMVLFKDGSSFLDLFVGQNGAASQTFYARKAQDSAVYLVSGSVYNLTKSDWKKPQEAVAETEESTL